MRKATIIIYILIILNTVLIKCTDDRIYGSYYIQNSNVKFEFQSNKLMVYDNNMPVYKAIMLEKFDNGGRYEITDIMIQGIWEKYRKEWLIKNNIFTIYIEENKEDYPKLRFTGNEFGNYNYNIVNDVQSPRIIQNAYLKEIEKNQLQSMNLIKLTSRFDLELETETKHLTDNINLYNKENPDSPALLPLDLINKIGIELSVKPKNLDELVDEDEQDDTDNAFIQIKNKDITIKAISITIPNSNYFRDKRPETVTILFSTDGKKNPAYYKYIYDTEVKIKLKDMPIEQNFYLMEDIISIYSITIIIDNFYDGLSDKITIDDIDFYIQY